MASVYGIYYLTMRLLGEREARCAHATHKP